MDRKRWLCRCKLYYAFLISGRNRKKQDQDSELIEENFRLAGHIRFEEVEELVWCCPHSGWCESHQTSDSENDFPPEEEATLDEVLDFIFRRIKKISVVPLDSKYENVVWKPAGPYWFYPLSLIKETSGIAIVPHFVALQVPDPAQYDKVPAGIVVTHEGGQECQCVWTPEARKDLKGPAVYAVVRNRLSGITPQLEKHARSLAEALFMHWIREPEILEE